MAETATPAKVSTGANPALTPKVDIVEVVAAAAALGVVRPETMHTTAAFKATGVARTSFTLGETYVTVIVPEMAAPALVHVAVGLLLVKEVTPVKVITAAAVADAPVNPTVMVEAVAMRLLANATEAEVKAPANMAGTATPTKVSTGANPELTPKVDIVEVLAAATALGVDRPETTHTTAASYKATGVARTSFKLGEEYVAVIVPEMALPALVHVAVRLLPVKEAKPVKVITAAAVVDAPVNPMLMEEAVEMTLLENETEADVKAPACTAAGPAKHRINRHSRLKLF